MRHYEHKKSASRFCPKCGALVIAVMDDTHRKEIEECTKCDYKKEKAIKKS